MQILTEVKETSSVVENQKLMSDVLVQEASRAENVKLVKTTRVENQKLQAEILSKI